MCRFSNMILLAIACLMINAFVSSKAPLCCSSIVNEKCRQSCVQVHNQDSPIPQIQMLLTSAEECTPEFTDFWQCINATLPAVRLMKQWPGKACCDMAKGKECRKKCNSADSRDTMERSCKENSEASLVACINNQEDGHPCCSKAIGTSCGIVCQGIYLAGVSSNLRPNRKVLGQHCRDTDKMVETCVLMQRQPQSNSTQHYLPCCDKAQTASCKSKCRSVLQTVMSEEDQIEEVIKACSYPQPTDPLWQCFLHNPQTKKNESAPLSVDNAKFQCCGKAASARCRELCSQTYRKRLSYQSEFESSCSYIQPVSTVESSMHNCLNDVDLPCKLGCSGLSFCHNFNHRPTELFRSCTPAADAAAERVYNFWKNGVIHLHQLTIPVKDIDQCKPAMWKAIACALEIKPCISQQSLITLCKEDCLLVLNMCVDTSKSGEQTVPALCNALPSKHVHGTCVSMDQYLHPSPYASRTMEVKHPCNPNPCGVDEVCLVRRRVCKHDCLPYVCHKACRLGQESKLLVPKGTNVRLANLDADVSLQEDCYQACYCSSKGLIENCKSLPCLRRDACQLGHENSREHGAQFSVDGSKCVCFSGKVICSRRTCHPDNSPLYTGMPGSCPTEYDPVCGPNGKTYPNACHAKCAGVYSFTAKKACSDRDVCSQRDVCPAGTHCVPRPQICLNDVSVVPCPQYECVNESGLLCNYHHHDPVCSTTGEEFTNMCLLLAHRKSLAYRGHCQTSCSNSGPVCGHDGETYVSQCAAWAARVTVDYSGKCGAFGDSGKTCSRVECPPLHPASCEGVIPPGACCPICATQLTLLWDPRLMSEAANLKKTRTISTMDVLTSLSDHVSVQECDVFGHLSVNGELIVIIGPNVLLPTALQVEACQSEAERIHNLFKMGSPTILSYLTLSPFLLVSLEKSSVSHLTGLDPTYQSDAHSRNFHSADNSSQTLSSHFWVLVCFWVLLSVLCNKQHLL
ncbi:reversion-inducing cysteine-rich protein with Kazal motifs-like [Physella acuta]|uniref:reversion-inducing cysteine-rich protein with Kazal motifs-like n=1 Tax=Physella acuta TaxID=109671 RepID=UPI0027DE7EE4|nr:reversion-inducing cysteine-rich protein with Kazal motifs-like [Physella acuta]